MLMYLYNTRHLSLRFGSKDRLIIASDASFADNTFNWKNSQTFAIKLFNGLIGWRANKQNTIITLTIEAELLAFAQTAKESLFVSRLLLKLTIALNDQFIQINCDNTNNQPCYQKNRFAEN
jgi:hypothetical protein